MIGLTAFRRRPGGSYRPLQIALMGPPFIDDDWPLDIPITEDEIQILESQMLYFLPILNEASNED